MIDSTGRRFLRPDGTVFDLFPIGRVAGLGGALLVALFVLVKPEASDGLDTAARIAFWSLHVGLGLGALTVASRWLASGSWLPDGTLAAVLASGLVGIAIAAPGYLALDTLFAPHVVDRDPDPEPGAYVARLACEAVGLAPWFTSTWLLINLPVLLPRPFGNGPRVDDAVTHDDRRLVRTDGRQAARSVDGKLDHSKDSRATSAGTGTRASSPLRLVHEPDAARPQASTPQVDERGHRFLATLPGIVGTDVVAVASDLHYLNVWTVAGRTTVLGNLRDVVEDLGEIGLQVHRSHWVAHAHVRRIVGTAGDAACILSNELRVPVSRRRWKAVREQYGRGVVHAHDRASGDD